MNVRELKSLLGFVPDDMEIVVDRHGDYALLAVPARIKCVPQDYYHMRSHPTMSDSNKAKEKEYLYFTWDLDCEAYRNE